jgi:hypothetical protein
MKSETAWEKALCRLFFCASKEKAYSKQSGWNILLKNVHGNRVMLLCRRSYRYIQRCVRKSLPPIIQVVLSHFIKDE